VEIDRATSESAAKSEQLGKAWARKKHLSEPGIAITGAMPAWLLGKNGEPIRIDEQKAKTVQLIFRTAASGMGKRLIARRLNERKVPTFSETTPVWAHSTVQKILFNRADLGEYQPYKLQGASGPKGQRHENQWRIAEAGPGWPAPVSLSSRSSSRKASGARPTPPCPPGERSTNEVRLFSWISRNAFPAATTASMFRSITASSSSNRVDSAVVNVSPEDGSKGMICFGLAYGIVPKMDHHILYSPFYLSNLET
jgi:hypothetical protein